MDRYGQIYGLISDPFCRFHNSALRRNKIMTCNPAPTNMSDEQIQQWIEAVRNLYHTAKLRSWQIKRLEKIPGWTWTERGSLSLDAEDSGSGAMHKELAQVSVAALADAE